MVDRSLIISRLNSGLVLGLLGHRHQLPYDGLPVVLCQLHVRQDFRRVHQLGHVVSHQPERLLGLVQLGAFQAWMNSPGHRANILNPQYNYTGIGIVHGCQYGIMFTQEFVGR